MTASINDLLLTNLTDIMARRAPATCSWRPPTSAIRSFWPASSGTATRTCNSSQSKATFCLRHPDYNYGLNGTIVASTYPLHAGVQRWSSSGDKRILFPTQDSQGYFNAALAILGRPEYMLDYGWKNGNECSVRPPIWISVVGKNQQIIPVHYISPQTIDANLSRMELEPPVLKSYFSMYPRPADQTGSQSPGAAFTNTWLLLSRSSTGANVYLLRLGKKWFDQSTWPNPRDQLNNKCKQRIDLALACAALVPLYCWVASFPPFRSGNLPTTSPWGGTWPAL